MIKKIFKILAIIFGFMIVVFIGLIAIGIYAVRDLGNICINDFFKEYSSPDKTKKVVIYERDCGATTTWNTNISILDYDKQFDDSNENFFSIKGRPSDVAPNITWIDNKNIIIHHKVNGEEIRAENEFGSINPIKITYE